MPFSVSRTKQNNTDLIQLSDNNHSTTVTIIPSVGAMLHEFIIQINKQPFNIIDNYQLNRPVKEQVTDYFKSIKLSPWVCRMNEGRYNLNGVTHQSKKMYKDGTALHGLLYDQAFDVESESTTEASASVVIKHDYKGYDSGYPFHYTCQVRYTLHSNNKLEVETTVINQSDTEIPIADGWHPYFKLGGKVNSWQLFFPAKAKLVFNEKLIPTGEFLPFDQFNTPSLIGNTEMDNCFLLEEMACTLYNPANGLKVSLLSDASYPFLQVFIPGHRESIAIENLSSAPDSFNNHIGLVTLQPGERRSFRVFYTVLVE
jgi:aldose 1-epimerase